MNYDYGFAGYQPRRMLFYELIVNPQTKNWEEEPPHSGSGERSQDENQDPDEPGEKVSLSQCDQPESAPDPKPYTRPPKYTMQLSDVFDSETAILGLMDESGAPDMVSL